MEQSSLPPSQNPNVLWNALSENYKTLTHLGSTRTLDHDDFLARFGSYQFPNIDAKPELLRKMYSQLNPEYSSLTFSGHTIKHCGSAIVSLANALALKGVYISPKKLLEFSKFNSRGLLLWEESINALYPLMRFKRRYYSSKDLFLSIIQFPTDLYLIETNRVVSPDRNFWVVPIDSIREIGSKIRIYNSITDGLETISLDHIIGGTAIEFIRSSIW